MPSPRTGRDENVSMTDVVSYFPASDFCWSVETLLAGAPDGEKMAELIV